MLKLLKTVIANIFNIKSLILRFLNILVQSPLPISIIWSSFMTYKQERNMKKVFFYFISSFFIFIVVSFLSYYLWDFLLPVVSDFLAPTALASSGSDKTPPLKGDNSSSSSLKVDGGFEIKKNTYIDPLTGQPHGSSSLEGYASASVHAKWTFVTPTKPFVPYNPGMPGSPREASSDFLKNNK